MSREHKDWEGRIKKKYNHFYYFSVNVCNPKVYLVETLFLRLLITGNGTAFYACSSDGKRRSSRLQLGQRHDLFLRPLVLVRPQESNPNGLPLCCQLFSTDWANPDAVYSRPLHSVSSSLIIALFAADTNKTVTLDIYLKYLFKSWICCCCCYFSLCLN